MAGGRYLRNEYKQATAAAQKGKGKGKGKGSEAAGNDDEESLLLRMLVTAVACCERQHRQPPLIDCIIPPLFAFVAMLDSSPSPTPPLLLCFWLVLM